MSSKGHQRGDLFEESCLEAPWNCVYILRCDHKTTLSHSPGNFCVDRNAVSLLSRGGCWLRVLVLNSRLQPWCARNCPVPWTLHLRGWRSWCAQGHKHSTLFPRKHKPWKQVMQTWLSGHRSLADSSHQMVLDQFAECQCAKQPICHVVTFTGDCYIGFVPCTPGFAFTVAVLNS